MEANYFDLIKPNLSSRSSDRHIKAYNIGGAFVKRKRLTFMRGRGYNTNEITNGRYDNGKNDERDGKRDRRVHA